MDSLESIRRRKLRLWHLSVAVLVASLVFGVIRALAREPDERMAIGVSVPIMISIGAGISFTFIRVGETLMSWATADLRGRGDGTWGVVGFCVWLLGFGLYAGFSLASIVIVPVATIVFILWLARVAFP